MCDIYDFDDFDWNCDFELIHYTEEEIIEIALKLLECDEK